MRHLERKKKNQIVTVVPFRELHLLRNAYIHVYSTPRLGFKFFVLVLCFDFQVQTLITLETS